MNKKEFKKKYLGDKSGYWFEQTIKTPLGKITFAHVHDGGINTIELEGVSQDGGSKDYVLILHTKSFKKWYKKYKQIMKLVKK